MKSHGSEERSVPVRKRRIFTCLKINLIFLIKTTLFMDIDQDIKFSCIEVEKFEKTTII